MHRSGGSICGGFPYKLCKLYMQQFPKTVLVHIMVHAPLPGCIKRISQISKIPNIKKREFSFNGTCTVNRANRVNTFQNRKMLCNLIVWSYRISLYRMFFVSNSHYKKGAYKSLTFPCLKCMGLGQTLFLV